MRERCQAGHRAMNSLMSAALGWDICLSSVYAICRLVKPVCDVLPPQQCGLNSNETEVYILAIFAAILRCRRSGSWRAIHVIRKICLFIKLSNIVLFMRLDSRLLFVYTLLLLINLLLFGNQPPVDESSPSRVQSTVEVLTGKQLKECIESRQDSSVPLLIAFHVSWSPQSQAIVKLLAEMSASGDYIGKVTFATVEISHDLETARRYDLDNAVTSTELPALMLFRSGQVHLEERLGPKALAIHEGYICDRFSLKPS